MYHCFNSSDFSVYFLSSNSFEQKNNGKTQNPTTMLFSAQSLLLQGYVVVPQGD